MKTVFVSAERCLGCAQCSFACALEHSASHDAWTAQLEEPLPRPRVHIEPGRLLGTSYPSKCRHCDPAPCAAACPTGAVHRSSGGDLVLVDARKCISCATCAVVCPFDAVTFHAARLDRTVRIVATKCDGCMGRLERGGIPACADACKTGALTFGELNELIKADRRRTGRAIMEAVPSEFPLMVGLSNHGLAGHVPDTVAAWRSFGHEIASTTDDPSEGGMPA